VFTSVRREAGDRRNVLRSLDAFRASRSPRRNRVSGLIILWEGQSWGTRSEDRASAFRARRASRPRGDEPSERDRGEIIVDRERPSDGVGRKKKGPLTPF